MSVIKQKETLMTQELHILIHCARCDTYKQSNEFYKNKGRPNGLAAYCIMCEKDSPRRYNTGKGQQKGPKQSVGPVGPRKPRMLDLSVPDGMLKCKKCQESKTPKEFHKNSSTKRGYATICKKCRSVPTRPRKPRRETNETGQIKCVKCNLFKNPDSFYNAKNSSGKNSKCKSCVLGHEIITYFKSDTHLECRKCRTIKPIEEFASHETTCKQCNKVKHSLERQAYLDANPKIPRERHSKYKRHAEERNIIFNITPEEFNAIVSGKCTYCGTDQKIGIDRYDNNVGYILSNCVPCCGTCNFIKRTMSVAELKDHLIKMITHMSSTL